ncbi:hypothetical protein BV898_11498 [Hypsibius exemplaris]|uniref:Uncharacterized protein n=1 Tax=Hypsibius exemplaris TaxID=2072580 RepID=A0A1W0WGE3_HYPEX|nr:hypothetical protein BV898_11498 [Hypsibius exemplaris]
MTEAPERLASLSAYGYIVQSLGNESSSSHMQQSSTTDRPDANEQLMPLWLKNLKDSKVNPCHSGVSHSDWTGTTVDFTLMVIIGNNRNGVSQLL